MWGRGRVRPSKPLSLVLMIVGIVFIGIGAFMVIPRAGAFGILWTLFAAGMTVYHAANIFSERGVAHEVVDFETSMGPDTKEPDVESRLQKVESLKRQRLLTDEEYKQQRKRILDEI